MVEVVVKVEVEAVVNRVVVVQVAVEEEEAALSAPEAHREVLARMVLAVAPSRPFLGVQSSREETKVVAQEDRYMELGMLSLTLQRL